MQTDLKLQYVSTQSSKLQTLVENMVNTSGLDDIGKLILPDLARILKLNWIGLFIPGSGAAFGQYLSYGLSPGLATYMERSCIMEYHGFADHFELPSSILSVSVPHRYDNLHYYPVISGHRLIGLLQMEANVIITNPERWEQFLTAFSRALSTFE